MEELRYTRADLIALARRIFREAGGRKRLEERIENYRKVQLDSGPIHNYSYVWRDVFDYGDLDAMLGLAAIFLDAGEGAREAGRDFIRLLCCLSDNRYLLDYTFCDRAFDGYEFQLLAHAYMLLRDSPDFAAICTPARQEKAEGWFHERASLMLRDRDAETWSTFRPYDNQEIGIGGCTLLAALLEGRDPALAQGLRAVADERLIGWERKNGNLDDTLFYTPIFAKALYFHAVYRPRPELLDKEGCRQTFEGLLQQQSGSGICTVYNWTQCGCATEMMALGAHLFHDGRYQWMACRLLEERLNRRNRRMQFAARGLSEESLARDLPGTENEELRGVIGEELHRRERYDHVWEGLTDNLFHLWYFWDDALEPVRPAQGSLVLEKSAGQGRWPHDPDPILPDKLMLREGWKKEDLSCLFSLWGGQNSPSGLTVSHRYPASNELISLICGEQFLVQNIDQVTRDVHIHRKDLNAFDLQKEGSWLTPCKVMRNPKGRTFGIYPALESYNPELRFFETGPHADGFKSTLYEYYGWTSERTALLIKGKGLAVFDQSFGPDVQTGGTRWHLQGEPVEQGPQSLRLRLLESELQVFYPHEAGSLQAQLAPNRRPVAIYQHHADYDLDLLSAGSRMGALTLFIPGRIPVGAVRPAKVLCAGHPAHPNAMGAWLDDCLLGSRLGMYRDEYDYDGVKTDAGAFLFERKTDALTLTLFDARVAKLPAPSFCGLDARGLSAEAQACWRDGVLTLRFRHPASGTVTIGL